MYMEISCIRRHWYVDVKGMREVVDERADSSLELYNVRPVVQILMACDDFHGKRMILDSS